MDRALRRDQLSPALGELPEIPSPQELQRLLADAELSLFAGRAEIPDELIRTGWYLHAIASTSANRIDWPRRASAFRISAHILEIAATTERPVAERLDCVLGSELGYHRGGLDPNATAVFAAATPFLSDLASAGAGWRPTLAVEAAIYLLSFRTSQTFEWLNARRQDFQSLRRRTTLDDLAARCSARPNTSSKPATGYFGSSCSVIAPRSPRPSNDCAACSAPRRAGDRQRTVGRRPPARALERARRRVGLDEPAARRPRCRPPRADIHFAAGADTVGATARAVHQSTGQPRVALA